MTKSTLWYFDKKEWNWALVLGKPSRRIPAFDSGSNTFWLIIYMITLSFIKPPAFSVWAIDSSAGFGLEFWEERANSFRISSPVEIWLNLKSFMSILVYVPLPTPGAPNTMINFWVLCFDEVVDNLDEILWRRSIPKYNINRFGSELIYEHSWTLHEEKQKLNCCPRQKMFLIIKHEQSILWTIHQIIQ